MIFNISFSTPGWLNDDWCHNSSEWYHCHGSWIQNDSSDNIEEENFDYNLIEDDKIKTWETYTRIIKKLKEKRSCSRIYSNSERSYCQEIFKEWDIYTDTEVLYILNKTLSCDFFYSLSSDKNECNYYKKTKNVFSLEEIKKITYNFTKCTKIRSFKKDYSVCKKEYERQLEEKEIKNKEEQRLILLNKKFNQIREVIDRIYETNPKKIKELQIKLFDTLPNTRKQTSSFYLLNKLNEYLKILVW